jgi:hypothetical protein
VEKWRQYLQHAPFTIVTDHRSLVHLADQKITTEMQQKAFVKLMGLQYKPVYRKGKDNTAADALSRNPVAHELCNISLARPRWLEIIVEGYLKDAQAQLLLQELSLHSPNSKGYAAMASLGTRIVYGLVTTVKHTRRYFSLCIPVVLGGILVFWEPINASKHCLHGLR